MSRERPNARNSSRSAAIRLVIGLAIGGGLIFAANHWLQQQQAQKQATDAQLADAEQRAATAIADRADLAAYKASYEQLKQRNILGEEARLPWAEHFNQVTNGTGDPLFLRFAIEPQRVFEITPKQALGELKVFASHMTTEAGLLHEGSIYRLLAGFKQVAGAHIVRSCDISRGDGDSTSGNLKLLCELDLITLKKPPEPLPGAPQ